MPVPLDDDVGGNRRNYYHQRRMTLMGCTVTLPRLTVIGTGYLGLAHAVCMADLGFVRVLGRP